VYERIYFFDEIRGFMIINVILYHLLYDVVYFYQRSISWFLSPVGEIWQEIICSAFILVSGACSYFSHNNMWRGIRLLGFAYLISLITYYMVPGYMIKFGILHMLGVSMIIFAIAKNKLVNVPNNLGIAVSMILYLLTFNVSRGYLGFPFIKLPLPALLYKRDVFFILGFYSKSFVSADYFPLLPYFFLFICGSFLGKEVQKGVWPDWFYKKHSNFWAMLGRHSLLIYLVHQPVIMAMLWLFFNI